MYTNNLFVPTRLSALVEAKETHKQDAWWHTLVHCAVIILKDKARPALTEFSLCRDHMQICNRFNHPVRAGSVNTWRCKKNWCVVWHHTTGNITQVKLRVTLQHVRTCTPLFHNSETAGPINPRPTLGLKLTRPTGGGAPKRLPANSPPIGRIRKRKKTFESSSKLI